MKQENKRLLTVNALYALIPLLLILVPELFAGTQMQAYGAAYSAYMVFVEFCVVALPAIVWLITPAGRCAAQGFPIKRPTVAILLVFPLAVCAFFAMNALTILWFLLLNRFGITQMPETLPAPQSAAQLGIAAVIVALTPALCEEFFFRGVLQPALHRQLKPWAAIVLGGCLFGLVHGQIVAMPAHVILGMGLCLVAYWTRSLWYTVLWHLLQNGITVAITYFSQYLMQMTVDAEASAAMLEQEPLMMALSSGMMLGFFGFGAAAFLALLLFATYKQHKECSMVCAQEKAPLWVYAPMLLAAGCIVYLYVTGTIPLMGGGA